MAGGLWVIPDVEDIVVGLVRDGLAGHGVANGLPAGIPVGTRKPRDDSAPTADTFVRITRTGGRRYGGVYGATPFDDALVLIEAWSVTGTTASRLINLCRSVLEEALGADYGENSGVTNLPDPDAIRLRRYSVLANVRAHAVPAA